MIIDMDTVKKGDWVQISSVVLPAGSRAPQVPPDTQKCDLNLWVKGFLQQDAAMGDTVEVITAAGRRVSGVLCETNPGYHHSYGNFIPELASLQRQLRNLTFGGDDA